ERRAWRCPNGGVAFARKISRSFRHEVPRRAAAEAEHGESSLVVAGGGELAWDRFRIAGPHRRALDRLAPGVFHDAGDTANLRVGWRRTPECKNSQRNEITTWH